METAMDLANEIDQVTNSNDGASEQSLNPETRVYVGPTAKSLAGFKRICDDSSVTPGIHELVFLGNVMNEHWCSDIYRRKIDYMGRCEREVGIGDAKMPEDFVICTTSLQQSFKIYKKVATEYVEDRGEARIVLAQCLPKLSNLRKVVIATKIDRPGLNEDRFFYATGYQSNGVHSPMNSPDGGERLAYIVARDSMGIIGGVDTLIFELAKAKIPITELEIGNGLFDQLSQDINHPEDEVSEESLLSIAANLTHLSISVKDENDEEDHPLWRDFLAAAKNLNSICVYPECGSCDSVWHSAQEAGNVLGMILAHNTFPKLRTFRVIGKLDQPTKLRAVWLNAFLARHANTLRQIELSGCLIVNWYKSGNTRLTMRTSLQKMKSVLQLETAEMLLCRRDEHGETVNGRGSGCSQCDGICRHYLAVGTDAWIPVEEIDNLAKDLGVGLNGGNWDFGEFLMR